MRAAGPARARAKRAGCGGWVEVPKSPKGEPSPEPALHPRTPGHRAASRAAALLRAIRAVLRVALANRETSMVEL
jgi:hypothetical protein